MVLRIVWRSIKPLATSSDLVLVDSLSVVSVGLIGAWEQVREEKGLDQVRRDWSPLSKISGRFVLGHILSGAPREDVVAAIHAHLRQVADKVNKREVPLQQYVITKQLTKRPEEYPDAKNQPHVQVAMRRKAAGRRNGIAQVLSPSILAPFKGSHPPFLHPSLLLVPLTSLQPHVVRMPPARNNAPPNLRIQ